MKFFLTDSINKYDHIDKLLVIELCNIQNFPLTTMNLRKLDSTKTSQDTNIQKKEKGHSKTPVELQVILT